ncbi:MAG: hypothetical protein JSR99_08025 [Proteobacteria bacterium]|nr:hypothetical protein [Pseudomonadota bacterium]
MAPQSRAILFSEMTPPQDVEERFNRWYDEHHIPLRMNAPGFTSAQRYRDGNERNYLAVYEMDTETALQTPRYKEIKSNPSPETREMLGAVSGFTRYLAREISSRDNGNSGFVDSPVLYPVFFDVPPSKLSEFDSWYDEDHVPILLEDKRWLGVRRFEIYDGEPGRYNRLALHYLSDREVLESDARKRARETPWRARLAQEPWFKGHYLIFDRLGDRFRPAAHAA